MGSAMEIGIKIRKIVFISIRGVYRSACNHPFLVGFFGFLFLLYRCFPFLFSVLVSASPVLVCTALLLGTLLSFGQPNLPEFEKEEKVTHHDISSFQIGFSEGETVVSDRDESYFVKGYSEHRSDIEENGIEEENLVGEKDDRTEEDRGLLYDSALEDENLEDIQPEKQVEGEVKREFHSFELGKSREVHEGEVEREFHSFELGKSRELHEGEVEREFHSFELGKSREVHEENLISEVVSSDDEAIEKQYVLVQKEDDDFLNVENEKTRDEFDSYKEGDANGSPSSSWKQVENNGDYEDESVESGSDKAESSSPDASMADIMPMLDELHPLLDVDAPQPTHISRDGSSDSASEKSQKSDDDYDDDDDVDDSGESDEDIENHGEAEDGVDEDEEEMEGGKEDESKSAIKWTEDDQKNLIDLGTLELERNRRLENLIARRRARRMVVEKNLIDLDSADIPCNVAPISVRRNPFDFPDESYAAMGLPPIPGSAPSILQPRRNPFDIPYDPNEEKPDLKGDSFQQEFTEFTQKDPFFRRHESFSMGPSVLGISKQERHDFNWKPVFISERMASEGTSYFQRQSSEVSDSKLSSVPDTESVSSADQDERQFSEHDVSPENELTSNIDHASDDADHGSVSSGENDSVEMIQVEERNILHDEVEIVLGLGGVEDPSEMEFYPATGELEIHEQFNEGETRLRREPSVDVSSSRSSQTSRSEVIDNIPDEELEKTANMHQEDGHLPESRISRQASVEETNFQHVSGEVEEHQHVEPVYDSSPPTGEKLQSFLSGSSDSPTEYSDSVLPPVSVETTADVADKESEVHSHRLEDYSSDHEKNQATSSELHVEVKNESRSEKSEDMDHHNVIADELSAVVPNFIDQNGSAMADFEVAPISVESNFSSDIGSEKGVTHSGLVHQRDLATQEVCADSEMLHQDNVDSPDSNYQLASEKSHLSDSESVEEVELPNDVSRYDNADVSVSVQDADEMLDAVASDAHNIPSNDSSMHAVEDLLFSPVAGLTPIFNLPSEETEHIERISSNEELIFPIEQDKASVSSSVEQGNTNIHQDLGKNMVSFTSDNPHEIDFKSLSNLESHLSSFDELVAVQSSYDHDESQNSDDIQVGPAQGVGTSNDGVGELHEANEISVNSSAVTSEKSDTPEFGSPTGEVDSEVYKHGGEVEDENKNQAHQYLFPSADAHADGFMTPPADGFMSPHADGFMTPPADGFMTPRADGFMTPRADGFMTPLTGEHINDFFHMKEIGGEVEDENENEAHHNLAPSAEGFMSPLTGEHINEFYYKKEIGGEVEDENQNEAHQNQVLSAEGFMSPLTGEHINEFYHKKEIGGEVEDENQNEAHQNLVPSAEDYMSPLTRENSNEFDYMKEYDEEFLSELDTVGDFSVGDSGVSLHTGIMVEETRDAQPEDVKIAEVEQDIPVLEARSREDIDLAFKQLQEGVDVEDVILPSSIKDQLVSEESKDHVEVNSDLQVIEARSLEDIDVALQRHLENIVVSEESKDHMEVNEARSLEDIDVALQRNSENIDVGEESKDPVEVNSDLQVIEARCPEDIDVDVQKNLESIVVSEESKDHVEVNSDIQVIAARPQEDIDVALEKNSENIDVSEESKDHVVVNSDNQVTEGRSFEDIDVALPQNSEDNQEELPKKLDSKDASVNIEANASTKVNESVDVATNAEDISRTTVDKPENVSITSSSNKEESHSKKPHSKKSSSSSSSSSSDSD